MARSVLCVAEKPSIAKAVANHLGGRATAVRQANRLRNEDLALFNVASSDNLIGKCPRYPVGQELQV